MFDFLKRCASAASKTGARPATGNRPAAWDDWEHSQMDLDSRLGPLSAYDSVKVKNQVKVQISELAPFDAIRVSR